MNILDEKLFFPTKSQLMGQWDKQPVALVSNHYSVSLNEGHSFTKWQLSFIDAEDLDSYTQDPEGVQESLPADARVIIADVKKANGKELRQKIGANFLHGNVLYSVSESEPEDSHLILTSHPLYVMICRRLETGIGIDELTATADEELKRQLTRFVDNNIEQVMHRQNYMEWGRGRSYFNTNNRRNIPGKNIGMFDGFKVAAGFYEQGIRLLFDATTRVLRFNNMWEEFLNQEIGTANHDRVCDFFIGKFCMANYGHNRVYRIDDIDFIATPMSAFPNKDYKNYEEYFMKKYGVPKLKYPDQFMLVYKNRVAELATESKKQIKFETIYLIPELMLPTGLSEAMKGDRTLLEDLDVHRHKAPDQRFLDIGQMIKGINEHRSENASFHFNINAQDNTVTGYRLDCPVVKTGEVEVTPNEGRIELTRLSNDRAIDNWVLVYDYKNEKDYPVAIDNLMKAGSKYNLAISEPKALFMLPKNSGVDQLEQMIRKQKLKAKPDLVFFLVGDTTARFLYKKAKAFYNSKGTATQFFVDFNPSKDSTNLTKYNGIILQMVAKLGGVVYEVVSDRPGMVVAGVDTATIDEKHNVVSLACQMGPNFNSHYSAALKQKTGAQIMNSVYKMVMDSVKYYLDKYKELPENYVVFRKGVNKSAYDDLIEFEIKRTLESFQACYAEKAPKLTYVAVNTRVDERFAIKTLEGFRNPESGLVVLEGVVERDYANFYLVSQHAPQGSVNPTQYKIIYNSSDLKIQDIVELAYSSTFQYTNHMQSIRLPAMVQNANKLSRLIGIAQDDNIAPTFKEKQYYL